MILVRVVADRFVAGFVYDPVLDRCVEAAPILRRSVLGKDAAAIRQLALERGWVAMVCKVEA